MPEKFDHTMHLSLFARSRMHRRTDGVDMLHGPLLKKIILFALPLAASSILQQLFNAADTAVVGRFAGKQAMAAVGSNSSLINLIIALFVGLSVGTNVLISSLIGQKKEEQIPTAVQTSVLIALFSGIALSLLGMLIARPMLRLVRSPEDVIDLAVIYLRLYFLGMPAIMLYNFDSAILRSMGDSRRPLLALAAAGVINVLLNLFFVIVLRLSVVGVGLATLISNIISAALTLLFLIREEGAFHLDPRHMRINAGHLRKIIHIGLPAGVQGMVFSLSNTVIQSAINSFGSAAVAGSAAAVNFDAICFYSVNAFNQATVTFTSQNYAAGKYDRCRKVFRISLGSALLIDLLLSTFFVLTRFFWLSIFTTDPAVLEYASLRFTHVLIFHFLVATYEISGSTLRGMGYSLTPAVIMIFGTCVFRLFWVFFVFPKFGSFVSLLHVYPVSWTITGSAVLSTYLIIRHRLFSRGSAEEKH